MHKTEHVLSERHFKKVICCPSDIARRMEQIWALTWRPGDKTSSFLDKVFRPRTSPVCITQSSEMRTYEEGKRPRRQRQRVFLNGYLTLLNPETGAVTFGGEQGCCFAYDFGMRPHPGARGKIINVNKNADLVHIGLELHRLRQRALRLTHELPTAPRLPTCFLGFRENGLPPMEDTSALRHRVSAAIGRSIAEINAMHPDERNPLLRAQWASCFRPPSHPSNDTGLYLISQQLCSKVRFALRDYLCFEELLGTEMFNPVRRLMPTRSKKMISIPNPAYKVLRYAHFKPEEIEDWNAAIGDEEVLVGLVKRMRQEMGPVAEQFDDNQIIDLLPDWRVPARLPVYEDPLRIFGRQKTLRLMKHHLGRYSECCREDDLVQAAENPGQPLVVAGLVRVQVLYAPQRIEAYYKFDSDRLGLTHVNADFINVRPWWRHEQGLPAGESDARGMARSA